MLNILAHFGENFLNIKEAVLEFPNFCYILEDNYYCWG
jgi:hypothetical protein